MTNRREQRASRVRPVVRRSNAKRGGTLRVLVVVAVFGLILVALVGPGLAVVSQATPTP